MDIILVASDKVNIYTLYERFGFKGSWRADALYYDYDLTFAEIIGLSMENLENYKDGFIIKPEFLKAQQYWLNNVSDMNRIHDMYRLKEWLRLAIEYNIDIAVI